MSFTCVLTGFSEKPRRSFRWILVYVSTPCCKTTASSYVNLLTTYLAKKKQCSKLATETLGKDAYWFKVCFQFCFQVRRSVISTIVDPHMSFCEKWETITEIFDLWKFKMPTFFFLKTQPQKQTNFSTFYLIFKGLPFQYHKVRHPNFL